MNIDRRKYFHSLLRQKESEILELKETYEKEVEETTGAFANTKGGIILIGVSKKGKTKGASISKETLKDWANRISQATEPMVIPEIESQVINKKDIVIVQIKEFPLKPVAVRGRCYRRVKNSNRVMTPSEIAEMHLHSTGGSWDALVAQDASVDDIGLKKFREYLKKAEAVGRRKFGGGKPLRVLEKLELIKDNKPTWASIILFSEHPQRKLSQATVHCGRFKKETLIIDDKMIGGNAIDQVDEVMDFIRKNINVRFEITGAPRRKEIWDYPLDALREAVINAICHRDYADSSDIQLKIYDDELTIWNPGGLPFGMTIEELYNPRHSSKPRNKLIAQIFYDVDLIEKYGSGIQRIMNACTEAGIPKPEFEEKFGGFFVIFRKDIYTEEHLKKLGLDERQIKAVMYTKEKGKIANKEYQKITGLKKRQSTDDLKELENKQILMRIGTTGKSAYYVLKGRQRGEMGIKGAPKGRKPQ